MNTTQSIGNDLKSLAEHSRDLLYSTAAATSDKAAELSNGLSGALESGKAMANQAGHNALRGAKVACDRAVKNPYQTLGILIGLGAIIVLATRLSMSRRD
jgi:ElaB/YqjD/DUF883 family membrane-anchored ribosome-binding protein